MHRVKVRVVEDALDANNTIARANRDDFDRAGVRVLNLMSAPGSGKTSLLERVLGDLDGVRVGVLEGDVQGSYDADRLASLHIPVTQLNTDPGFGGECHLDANMVRSALGSLPLGEALPRTLVLGCEPAGVEEFTDLSEPVRAALEPAEKLLEDILRKELS